jgi:hypothetical protein
MADENDKGMPTWQKVLYGLLLLALIIGFFLLVTSTDAGTQIAMGLSGS